ncbi:barstar family protein [Bacillus pseudomycoides]|uniref:barstar family protein n=1 Tax=Bacillus pseudomycoides TaxID=64104 RepID=UPI000BED6C61|nr:barstar family protein [Bacillus pseudomycoides]PED05110.1 barnase inhibitor [Bacillus pseudomycoides]PEI85520.1 barnase inhibitor [Bacillus pseudomycoides]PEK10656.1 barnase inhibitor [Bacillus pseudomycoides]PEM70774.1 barnase inhibitor [Bacillus pseudomycoides]PEO10147.1 barnase inhibitor [Bacillus pseudomycoides]
MEILRLDGRKFTSGEVLHKVLKKELDLPDYYGENADALWDCLTAWVILPLTIEWEFFEESKKMLGEETDIILETFQDAQEEMPGRFFIVVK